MTIFRSLVRVALVATALGSTSVRLRAQMSIESPGVALTQDFNSLGTNPSTWSSNSTLPGVYAGGDGQMTSGYRNNLIEKTSYGISYTNPASDRALGMSLLDNWDSSSVWYGFRFVNNTGETLFSVEISYAVERYYGWADEGTRFTEGFRFYTAINPVSESLGNPYDPEWQRRPSMEYHPVAGPVSGSDGPQTLHNGVYYFDGNHADYRTLITGTLNIYGGLADGGEYWIMLGNNVLDAASPLRNADGLGIDDLSVTFSTSLAAVPEPSTYVLFVGLGVLGLVLWRRKIHA